MPNANYKVAAVCSSDGINNILPQSHIWLFKESTGNLLYGHHARGDVTKWENGKIPGVSTATPLVFLGAVANIGPNLQAMSEAWFECGSGSSRKLYVCTGSPMGVKVDDALCPF